MTADGIVETALGQIHAAGTNQGDFLTVLIPPDAAQIADSAEPMRKEGKLLIHGRVKESIFQGSFYRVDLEIRGGQTLIFHLPNRISRPVQGENLTLETEGSAWVCIQETKKSQAE
ncbi:MAG: TOBE domain-containing protein [Desulfobacterales bacterium]